MRFNLPMPRLKGITRKDLAMTEGSTNALARGEAFAAKERAEAGIAEVVGRQGQLDKKFLADNGINLTEAPVEGVYVGRAPEGED